MSARPAMRISTPETRSAFSEGGWQLRASCRGASPDMFYPPENARGNTRRVNERPAKQVCESCPVLVPCRRYAVDAQEPHGIWGGTTPRNVWSCGVTEARSGRLPTAPVISGEQLAVGYLEALEEHL
jgi:hypothetical protein